MFKFFKGKMGGGGAKPLKVSSAYSVDQKGYVTTGERDAILASSGMGKSYLCGVLMEETLENGSLLCVIDPEGEHFTLAERYPMMIIGGEHGNLPLEEDAMELYIDVMLGSGVSAVFDLSEYMDQEQQHLYGLIADKLFYAQQKYRRKVRLVVEEAQIYAPQRSGGGGTIKKGKKTMDPLTASQKIAKRGRKRAIDSLWATQRPASISKDILSQCNRFWFGGITSEQDYKSIKPFLTEAGISFADIKKLSPGEFYYFGRGETKLIKVRKRHCKHAGSTPEAGMRFEATKDRPLVEAISKLAEEVNKRAFEKKKEESEAAILKRAISDLESERERLIKELEEERMATKVIDRLGSKPPASKTRGSKPTPVPKMFNEDELSPAFSNKIHVPESREAELQEITTTAGPANSRPDQPGSSGAGERSTGATGPSLPDFSVSEPDDELYDSSYPETFK